MSVHSLCERVTQAVKRFLRKARHVSGRFAVRHLDRVPRWALKVHLYPYSVSCGRSTLPRRPVNLPPLGLSLFLRNRLNGLLYREEMSVQTGFDFSQTAFASPVCRKGYSKPDKTFSLMNHSACRGCFPGLSCFDPGIQLPGGIVLQENDRPSAGSFARAAAGWSAHDCKSKSNDALLMPIAEPCPNGSMQSERRRPCFTENDCRRQRNSYTD